MQAKMILLAGGALLGSGSAALASGFQVNLAGQKNIGMGGVGVGLSLDQAAMFYNPGALAMVRGNGVMLGASMAMPRLAFQAQSGGPEVHLKDKNVYVPNFYAAFGPKSNRFKIGIGAYAPFGSELKYDDNSSLRYSLTDIRLRSVFAQLTASVALSDKFSIGGAAVMLAYGDVNLQRDSPVQLQTSTDPNKNTGQHVTLDGTAKRTFGYNVGMLYKPSPKFSIGASYRSKVDAKVKGGDVGLRNAGSVGAQFTATNFDVTLPLPATASFGFGITPTEKLTIGIDANYVFWETYKSLDFTFSGNNGFGDTKNASGTVTAVGTPGLLGGRSSSSSARNYKNALAIRVGGQYRVAKGLDLRVGGFYDTKAVRDGYITPETPDADRLGLSAGLSYAIADRVGIDLSFLHEEFMKRTQTQEQLVANGTTDRVAGTYKTVLVVPGVGLFVKF